MNAKGHILICDDEPDLRDMISEYLERRGFETTAVQNGVELDAVLAKSSDIGAILLDVNMPGEDGFSILRRLRAKRRIPVIMLTAVGEMVDKVVGLEMGADDYLVKPVDLRELEARLKVVLRRPHEFIDQGLASPEEIGSTKRSRHLATILAIDVVGYSRLMNSDDERTLDRLFACRAFIKEQAEIHNGRTFGVAGDSILVEFASPKNAMLCAVSIQSVSTKSHQNAMLLKHLQLRIGASVGDVIRDGDNLYGTGVNIAARLEALCPPNGVCLSGTVREHIQDQLSLPLIDMGQHNLKNITHPVHVWHWLATTG